MKNIEGTGEVDINAPGRGQVYSHRHKGYISNYPYSFKSKTAAAILCWFLGWLGIHRLYIGKTAMGTIMMALGIIDLIIAFSSGWTGLVIFLTFLLGIRATIDFIIILCGAMRDGDGRLIKE